MHLTTRIAAGATVIALASSTPLIPADPTRDGSRDDGAQVTAAAPAAPSPSANS